MNASAAPAADAATAALSPSLAALTGRPAATPLTRVSLAFLEHRFKLYLRFGEPARTLRYDRWRSCAVFVPDAMFCRIRWQSNDYGTIRWQLMVMQACTPLDAAQRIPGVQPGARLLLHAEGDSAVRAVLERIDAIEALSIAPAAASPAYWRTLGNRLAARGTLAATRLQRRAARRLAGREGVAMTAHSTAVHSAEAASHPRSRLRARLVLAALSACGLAALAWASFGLPKPRLIYNPSDSVPVGWYRVDPSSNRTDSLPRPLSVGSIVLVPLPAEAATLAAQRGYLPTRVPLLKRVGAIAPQEVCIAGSSVRIDGVPSAAVLRADRLGRPLPSWRQCRRLRPGELFLLSRTNPASFDSRYFGPVSASAVIGVARPVWLDSRP